jgi:hypothetical protein
MEIPRFPRFRAENFTRPVLRGPSAEFLRRGTLADRLAFSCLASLTAVDVGNFQADKASRG